MSSPRDEYAVPDKAPELPPSRKDRQKVVPDISPLDSGLPANIDAEKTILGAILLDNTAFLEAADKLLSDDFSLDSHKRIFLRMGELMSTNNAVDIVTLAHELSRKREVEAIGGVTYLASLTEGLPLRPIIEDYIRIVKDKGMLRKLMLICSAVIARAADQSETALEIAGDLGTHLEQIVAGGIHHGLQPVSDVTIEVLDKYKKQASLETSPGFSFGVPALDDATGGIQEGEQVVVGCYSGVGKSTLMAQIVAANCSKGHPWAMYLIEPTRHTFLRQLWTIVSGVRYVAATKPWLARPDERDRLHDAAYKVGEWPLYLIDNSNLTLSEQIAHTRLAIYKWGIEGWGIDYIQRMKVPAADKHEDMRLRLGRASTLNADLAKEASKRCVMLSQLNRSGGMNTLPTMDKLRESGQLENDAATIVLLHLKYDEEQGHFTTEGAGIIPKQRFGVPCNVQLWKHEHTALWMSGPKDSSNEQQSLYQ